MTDEPIRLEEVVLTRLLRMNAAVTGIVAGIVAGLSLFIATNWLIIKGGPIGPDGYPVIGPHLWLLSHYFIGYKVSFVGSLIGFLYAFVLGFVAGYVVAWLYNFVLDLREGSASSLG